jgi:hypothetical protein
MTERLGEMRQWTGDDEWIGVTGVASALSQLQIRYGDLFWLDSEGGVLIDTVISAHIDTKLLQRSSPQGWVTRLKYKDMLRDKRIRECPENAPVIKAEQSNAPEHLTRLAKLGVRFY